MKRNIFSWRIALWQALWAEWNQGIGLFSILKEFLVFCSLVNIYLRKEKLF